MKMRIGNRKFNAIAPPGPERVVDGWEKWVYFLKIGF